ncbi:MAG: MBL fold metallo-hydrolase, partial [Spirochaetia bacterium]|nr:MBL fold metallo-hydrolase [Spirochaetia bacterium]
DLEERLEIQQQFKYFPVALGQMASKKTFTQFIHGNDFEIGPFKISTMPLFHPGGSTSYKIHAGGKTMIFATDTEFFGENLNEEISKSEPFFKDADLLLMDAQYSYEEAAAKIGWGHTSVQIAIQCALAWNVGELVLTHHEPAYKNQKIHELHKTQIQSMEKEIENHHLKIRTAIEGTEYVL